MQNITVGIPEDLYKDMKSNIAWGFRRHLITAVLRLIVDAAKEDGDMVVGAIISGDYKLVRNDNAKAG